MRPSTIALTLLAASMGSARAQSEVKVYGLLDAGMVGERGCAECSSKISSGVATGSHLGLRASEPLGDGLAAVFALEAGVLLDTGRSGQGGRLFGREAYLGLRGKHGRLTLGRQYSLEYLALTDVGDPFKGGMAGTATNLVGSGEKRIDNSVQFYSRDMHGMSAAAMYGAGDVAGDAASNRAWGISIGFERGPLTVRAAHQNRNVARVAPFMPAGNNMDAKNTILAANVRLGIVTAYAAYSANRGWGSTPLWNPDNPYGAAMASTPSTDSRDVLVGIAVPRGATTFLASFIHKNDRDLANRDAGQIAAGATYAVSRKTDFYAAYSHIQNRRGAGYTVGNASDAGRGSSALNIGMRHAF